MYRFLFLLLLMSVGCSSAAGEAVRVRSHHTTRAGPLVQTLQVELERSAPVRVEYWTSDGPRLLVDAKAAASTQVMLLTRLRANRRYHYRIAGSPVSGAFTTEALPPDLADVKLLTRGSPSTPLVLLHLYDPKGFRGYVAVDGEGQVVWYWRTVDLAFGAARRANGNAVFMDRARGLAEVRPDGTVVHELPQDRTTRELHHDAIVTPNDTVLFLAFDERPHAGASLKGEAIWEWTPETGRAVRRWSAWDHLSPVRDRGPRFSDEWLHANSLAIGPRGNIVVSLHFLNQVLSISPDFGQVEWRLGGVNATRPLPEAEQYSGQHTARELEGDRLLVFDNGFKTRTTSRVLEFDLRAATVRAVWQWQPSRHNLAPVVSSARRLKNGNTLVAFGTSAGRGATGPIEVYEVNAAGETVWHLDVAAAWQMYRAEPWPSIGSEYAQHAR